MAITKTLSERTTVGKNLVVLLNFKILAKIFIVITTKQQHSLKLKGLFEFLWSFTMMEKSLYERLGGVFAIAAVVNRFSDEVVKNRTAGQMSQNPALREWHTEELERLPGLKWMRTLWVCDVSGGPFQYTGTKPGSTKLGLEKAHFDLHISPDEFDAVAGELSKALDYYHVPEKEKGEVLAAFAAHKNEVTAGYYATMEKPIKQ